MTHGTYFQAPALLVRRLRIISGLYLLGYVTSHLINLGLGLVSVEAMDAARPWLSGIWGSGVTRPFMIAAFTVHYLLGIWAIYTRPRLTGTLQDGVQVFTGLTAVPLLATHATGVIMLQDVGVDFDYRLAIGLFWVSNPGIGLTQVIMLSVVWVHGCAGLFMWLRAKPAALAVLPWLYPLAVAVPVLALLGYAQAGRAVLASNVGPLIEQSLIAPGAPVPDIPFAWIKQVTNGIIWLSIAIGVGVLLARRLRHGNRRPVQTGIFTSGFGKISARGGQTLLDAYRTAAQPHANLCSGRGRCGTCAVRIVAQELALAPPTPLEAATLARLGKGPDVRLACQVMLGHGGRIRVEPLFPPDFSFDDVRSPANPDKVPT